MQKVFFPHVNEATARVLAAEGCEVVIPRGQPCCGALMVHSGLEEEAAALAREMIAAFEAADVETIVINSAGCGSTMKEYGHLLREDPEWAERAAAFSAKCKDISEILCELEPRAERQPLQDARGVSRCVPSAACAGCARAAAASAGRHPATRDRGDSGGDVCAAVRRASSTCCSRRQPRNLGRAKWTTCVSTGAEAVVSANPGCLLQLMNGLRARGLKTMPAFHMVELLDASMRGVAAEDLLGEGHDQITGFCRGVDEILGSSRCMFE